MFSTTPEFVMKEASDDRSAFLSIQRNISRLLHDNRQATPRPELYQDVACFLKEHTNLSFNPEKVESILSLYPHARIKLALYERDTEVDDLVLDAVAHFFLGCHWPQGKDEVDMTAFREAVRKQSRLMGFGPLE
jgi:hypothetical protein